MLLLNGDILIPALWLDHEAIIAYSTEGYKNKEWTLPIDWSETEEISLCKLSIDGVNTNAKYQKVKNNKINLSLNRGEGVIIRPAK